MFSGLVGNLLGSITNFVARFGQLALAYFKGTEAVTLYNTEMTEEIALSNAVTAANNAVTVSINQQTTALNGLIAQYQRLAATRMSGGQAAPPLRMATGGKVPGTGSGDKVPALLTPGEFVVKKQVSQKNSGFLSALNNGSVKGFNTGGGVGVSTPNSGNIRMSGSSGASVNINVNPDINQADLVEITDAIQRAVSNGVVNGTQSGLERARVDIQAGMDKTSGSRNPKSSFIAGSGNTGQAMKASQGQAFVGAHDTDGTTMSGAGFLNSDTSNIPDSQRMGSFLTGEDLSNAKNWTDELGRSKQEIVAIRQELIEVQRLTSSIDPQPDWLNDASKRQGGAGAREGSMSMLAMQNDPSSPNILDGTRASFDEYSDDNGYSSDQRASGRAKIDAAEQRIVAKLEEQADSLDQTARWVESSEQKARETDIAWNDIKADAERFANDPEMSGFNSSKKSPGAAGRSTVRGGLSDSSAARMGAVKDGRTLRTADGGKVLRTSETRGMFMGSNYEDTAKRVQKNTAGKNNMLNAGFSPAEVAQVEAKARAAGIKVADAFAAGVKTGLDDARLNGIQVGDATITGLKEGTASNSPSKKSMDVGKDVITGLDIGMEQGIPQVKATATNVGDQTEQALDASIDGQQVGRDTMNEVNQGIDSTPVKPAKKRFSMGGSWRSNGSDGCWYGC